MKPISAHLSNLLQRNGDVVSHSFHVKWSNCDLRCEEEGSHFVCHKVTGDTISHGDMRTERIGKKNGLLDE